MGAPLNPVLRVLVLTILFLRPLAAAPSLIQPATDAKDAGFLGIDGQIKTMMERLNNGFNFSSLLATLQPPPCMKNCFGGLSEAFSSALNGKELWTMSSTTNLCSQFKTSNECIDKSAGCSNSIYDISTGAFQYLCIDQKDVLNNAMPCVREVSSVVNSECDKECALVPKLENLTMTEKDKEKQMNLLDTNGNSMLAIPEMTSVCNASVCYMNCIREMIDEKCAGIGNSLMKNVFTTVMNSARGALSPKVVDGFGKLAENLLPEHCQALLNEQQRIMAATESPLHQITGVPAAEVKQFEGPPPPPPVPRAVPTSTQLMVDGAERTVECQMFDEKKGYAVAIPNSRGLAAIMRDHLDRVEKNQADFEDEETTTDTFEQLPSTAVPSEPVAAKVIVDGQPRKLQCQMYDSNHTALPPPEFNDLAQLMKDQILITDTDRIGSGKTEGSKEKPKGAGMSNFEWTEELDRLANEMEKSDAPSSRTVSLPLIGGSLLPFLLNSPLFAAVISFFKRQFGQIFDKYFTALRSEETVES